MCISVNTKEAGNMKYETKTGGETRNHGHCLCSGHNEAAGNWNMEMGFTEGMGKNKDI